MFRTLVACTFILLAWSAGAQAAINDVYTCTSERFITVDKNGKVHNSPPEEFRFKWGRTKAVLDGPSLLVEHENSYEIRYQNEWFVSAGGTVWGIVQFNEKTGVLTVMAPRLDQGTVVWSKCKSK